MQYRLPKGRLRAGGGTDELMSLYRAASSFSATSRCRNVYRTNLSVLDLIRNSLRGQNTLDVGPSDRIHSHPSSMWAVSYTHLDVYKRQVVEWIAGAVA